jgi:succinate-acetate transporter protein
VYYNALVGLAQGRFLFPVLSLIAVLVALGLQTVLANRPRWLQLLTVAGMVGVVIACDAWSVAMTCVHS